MEATEGKEKTHTCKQDTAQLSTACIDTNSFTTKRKLVVIFPEVIATETTERPLRGQETFLTAKVRTEINPHFKTAVIIETVMVKMNSHVNREC